MTIGATAFIAAAAAAGLMIQGGPSSSVASEGTSVSGNMNRAQIETIVHDYILAHPEIIPQAIERLQAKRTARSEEHTSELQSLMRISYAVFCLKKKKEQIENQ